MVITLLILLIIDCIYPSDILVLSFFILLTRCCFISSTNFSWSSKFFAYQTNLLIYSGMYSDIIILKFSLLFLIYCMIMRSETWPLNLKYNCEVWKWLIQNIKNYYKASIRYNRNYIDDNQWKYWSSLYILFLCYIPEPIPYNIPNTNPHTPHNP